jgi:hypothetical protein
MASAGIILKACSGKQLRILAKNNIQVDEDEAAVILNFLYHVAKTAN